MYLRKKAKKNKFAKDESEIALERQLNGQVGAEAEESRAVIIKASNETVASSIESDGHINFWADYERGVSCSVSVHFG